MPICPNCERAIEYKSGMVCETCDFDFNRYKLVPWVVLNLKFHPEKRTSGKLVATGVLILLPTLITMSLVIWLACYKSTQWIAIFIGPTIPVSVAFLLWSTSVFFWRDNLTSGGSARTEERRE